MRGLSSAGDGDVPYIQRAMLLQSEKNETVRDQENVVDYQSKNSNESVTVEFVVADEKLRREQCYPGEENALRQTDDLLYWRRRQCRINSKQGQDYRPDRKNDCEQPPVFPKPQHRVIWQVSQHGHHQAKLISKVETRRGQNKVEKPQVHGKNSFSLVNHL